MPQPPPLLTQRWVQASGQLALPLPERPLLEAVAERWGERVLWHLEGVRQGGSSRLSALPVVQLGNAAELGKLWATRS